MEEVSYTASDDVFNLSALISIFTIIMATMIFFIIHDIG